MPHRGPRSWSGGHAGLTRRREARDPRLVLRSVLVGGRGGVPGRPLGGPSDDDSEAALTCARVSARQLRPNSRSVGPARPGGLDPERALAALGFADLLLCWRRDRFGRQSSQRPLVGIFAQRGECRANRLGLSLCRLIAVDGLTATVQAVDVPVERAAGTASTS